MKMIGKKARVCDAKWCTCNSARRGRKAKRWAKRKARQP